MKRLFLLTAIIFTVILMQCAAAGDTLVWKIGESDNNFSEFAIPGDFWSYSKAFPQVEFMVGTSNPAKDWPFIQPGPTDAWAGAKEHTHKILFNLNSEPSGVYVLAIDMVDGHSTTPPVIEVRINRRSQTFNIDHGVSDVSLTRASNGREQIIKTYLDAHHLKKGLNEVQIISRSGSWFIYDSVSLSTCSNPPKTIERLRFEPTSFFKKNKKGLVQIMRASMDLWDEQQEIRTKIESDKGWKREQIFKNVPGGAASLDVEVPVVSEPQKVHLTLAAGKDVYNADSELTPRRQWKVYLLPSTHFDLGYTGPQARTLETHRSNIEKALRWSSQYPDFVWNLEGSYLAENFLANSPAKDDFIKLLKSGNIGVQGFYGNELTGVCSNEGLTRLVDYYDCLRNEYGAAAGCIMQTDVPSMVGSVPMILAGHGIKYMSHGINPTRANQVGKLAGRTPFYWQSPDGSRVLMWRTFGYGETGWFIGNGEAGTVRTASERIDPLLNELEGRKDYPYDAILLHGGYGDNQPNAEAIPRVVSEWNRAYEYPKLVFSTGSDFFEYLEANFRDQIKTIKGDGGVYWEDGVGSSSVETAANRIAKEQLVTAEKLTSLCDAAFQRKQTQEISKAWSNALLYDEHTWGAAQSIDAPDSKETREQWDVKKAFADEAASLASKAFSESAERLLGSLGTFEDSVVVFNPSSWERSEWVEFDITDRGKMRIQAESVPAFGYKIFPLSKAVSASPTEGKDDILENSFYRITFNKITGGIKSIYDKELGREMVDSSTYELNSYLYVTGATKALISWGERNDEPLKTDTPRASSLQKTHLPGEQKMTIRLSAPMANSMTSEIILHDDRKMIEFVNTLDKKANLAKEAGYFAFPFAFKNPSMRLEIPDAVIRPDIDQIPGACRDWYSVQHFMTISDGSAAVAWVPIDSPLVTLQDINRGQWYDKLDITNGNVFAYVFNNYWFTNYKASQDGKLTFRFAMTSSKATDDYHAKKFGESVQNPMVCKVIKGSAASASAKSHSYLQLKGDGVTVQAVKPARFTDGTVIRLREMSGKNRIIELVPSGINFKKAYVCNLAEDKLYPAAVENGMISVSCRPLGLTTVLLER